MFLILKNLFLCGGGGAFSLLASLNPLTFLKLLLCLYKTKQTHKQQQRFYKQTIQVFPSLKYPPLESCKDYKESLAYKYHLAYLLGEALSKADKDLFKGGYLNLNQEIKKAKQIYKIHKEYKTKLQELNLSYCFIPKEFLLESLLFLKAIESLMHKLKSQANDSLKIESFFSKLFSQIPFSTQTPFLLKHKEEILEWLNSQEFKEQYLATHHPYPPLLNPKRLNAKRESQRIEKDSKNQKNVLDKESKSYNEIKNGLDSKDIQPYPNLSYESISPELAWDLNLPLPPYYGFVWFVTWGSGFSSTKKYLSNFGVLFSPFAHLANKNSYFNIYNSVLTTAKDRFLCVLSLFRWSLEREKFVSLVCNYPLLVFFRDPVSIAKTYVNHLGDYWKFKQSEITLACQCDEVFDFFVYTRNSPSPKLEYWDSIESWGKIEWDSVLTNIAKENIISLDTKDIMPDYAFETMQKLAKKLGFFKKVESIMFADIVDRGDLYGVLPLTLYANEKDIGEFTYKERFKLSSLKLEDSIQILITTYQLHNGVGFVDIKNEMLDYCSKYPYLAFYIKESQIEEFRKNIRLYNATKDYLNQLIISMEKRIALEVNKRYNENDLLKYFKENYKERKRFEALLNRELNWVKANRPDIVESWKYYQEFERMCEELDK